MKRKILLVEPNYRNKYPPMGLMKIATYYRMLGDDVTFFKGDLRTLALDNTYELLIEKLYANNNTVFWEQYKPLMCDYIRKGSQEILHKLLEIDDSAIVKDLYTYYRKFFRNQDYFKPENRKYDRVGITTLFTFYWKTTINTINFAKQMCKRQEDVMIGGIMASILPDEVEKATGIRPYVGTLSEAGILDNNDIVIDTLPLDYSILNEIDYEYPENDGYLAYMTRGCINKCQFCAVPKLEPIYKDYISIKQQIKFTDEKFGGKRNLLLLDNNVLASKQFCQIVDEIKQSGFDTNARFTPPNLYEIAIKNIKEGYNTRGFIRSIVKQCRQLLKKYGNSEKNLYILMKENHLLEYYTATEKTILNTYDELKPWFEKFYNKFPLKRYVDFNQGIDARLITNENMKKLFEIPVKPVRIAFDHWDMHEIYENAVCTAVNNGHKNLSNYLLYNFNDKPIELYKRLKLNVELSERLNVAIYSFPMKYHPIEDPDFFDNRNYIGKYWNRKFIRTIQAILNSTKGKVGKGESFFYKAFGKDPRDFYKLLYMPEAMIIYRLFFEQNGMVEEWWNKFKALDEKQSIIAKKIIENNKFNNIDDYTDDTDVLEVLQFYKVKREFAEQGLRGI